MPLPPDKLRAFVGKPDPKAPQPSPQGQYGGKGPFKLPADHVAAMKVPKGGSSCASCQFGQEDANTPFGARCTEPNFIAWNGGNGALPAAADEFCSDWYRQQEE